MRSVLAGGGFAAAMLMVSTSVVPRSTIAGAPRAFGLPRLDAAEGRVRDGVRASQEPAGSKLVPPQEAAAQRALVGQAPAPQAPSPQAPSQETPAQPAPSQEPPEEEVRVTGKVVDRDGKPVENAQVLITGPKKHSLRTNEDGDFSFAGPAGTYEITVNASGERHKKFVAKIENKDLNPKTLTIDREGSPD